MTGPGDRRAREDRRKVRRGLWKATTNGVNLSVVGAAGAGAAAMGSWPILALGGAAYVALVAWDLSSPKFWSRVLGNVPAAEPVHLPSPRDVDQTLREPLGEILAAQQALKRVVDETPAEVLSHLSATLASVGELERRAAALLARGDALARFLVGAGVPAVREAVAELARRARGTGDPQARAQYESALAAKRAHLSTLEEIIAALDRIVAHLTRVAALLSSLPPKIVHLRSLDAEAMEGVSGDMSQELDSFTVEISSFEETLKTLSEAATT